MKVPERMREGCLRGGGPAYLAKEPQRRDRSGHATLPVPVCWGKGGIRDRSAPGRIRKVEGLGVPISPPQPASLRYPGLESY